ncbi:hypothetical protein B0H17DRAFT_1146888 [Mycena rosella]|uniref:Uncharacterized protein n=1 Tax=Mycena rosella TaxID=1033263 RepID=A0AAD7G4C9_MYCRO|nr:hypothetical protein B0H17DRAFT_1146888 [Mycena rosella]
MDPSEAEITAFWDTIDMTGWSTELHMSFRVFARLRDWGGMEWVRCVLLLVVLERVWGFRDKGMLTAPQGKEERPLEVPWFMQRARKWEKEVELEGTDRIGPCRVEGSLSARWWGWWDLMQPWERVGNDGRLQWRDDLDAEVWENLTKTHGHNRMLLVVGCLLWWGEVAAADGDPVLVADWQVAVENVAWAMGGGGSMKRLADEKSTADVAEKKSKAATNKALGVGKRKAAELKEDAEKENAKGNGPGA